MRDPSQAMGGASQGIGDAASASSAIVWRERSVIGSVDKSLEGRQPCSVEATMDLRERITSDPETLHGKVRVKGTRIPVSLVLENLAAGLSHPEILSSYPSLTEEDIRACLAYAADLANERVVDMRTGTSG
jgi:uncharacterized protein (DUF433 family)